MDVSIRQFAREVIQTESAAVSAVAAAAVDDHFERAVRLILDCPGAVLTSGIGKAGIIARKLSASFSSTGTPSHFLDPAQAVHGDLGSLRTGDAVVILSDSGETDEVLRMLSVLKKLGHPIIAMTSSRTSTLARYATVTLSYGRVKEACPLGLAPSASTTAMLALGDALFLSVMKLRNFTAEDFALFHPAGNLGRKLIKVSEAMTFRLGENLPVASDRLTVGQVLHEVSRIKRRSGAVILVNEAGAVSGIFSDGDLRRLITDNEDGSALRRAVATVMTRNPKRIAADALASEAMAIMKQYRIDELPVVDAADKPLGLIDVQDLVVLKMLDIEPDT
jgi:arabinose-5-phosphate isomerase